MVMGMSLFWELDGCQQILAGTIVNSNSITKLTNNTSMVGQTAEDNGRPLQHPLLPFLPQSFSCSQSRCCHPPSSLLSSLGHPCLPSPSVFQAPEAFSPWGQLSDSLCLFSLGKDFAPEFSHPFPSKDSGSSPELQNFILDG